MKTRFSVLCMLTLLAAAGCTYVCHDYSFVDPSTGDGLWHVNGTLYRYRPERHGSPPGSWPHWKAEKDDRYLLKLIPVAEDTSYWDDGTVHIRNVTVTSGRDTIWIEWEKITDLVETHRDRISPAGKPQPHLIEWGKMSFESEFFFIPHPVPDTLQVEFDLELIDTGTGEAIRSLEIRTPAVIDRHRRWSIVDAIES